MENLKIKNNRFKDTLAIAFIFVLIALVLLLELRGVQFQNSQKKLELLPEEKIVTKTEAYSQLAKDVLLLYSSEHEASGTAYEQLKLILADMKVGAEFVDVTSQPIPKFADYAIVIPAFSDMTPLGNDLVELCDWVRDDGGNVYFPLPIESTPYASVLNNKLGIMESSYDFTRVESIYVAEDFMLGGGQSYAVTDAYESARTVRLNPQTTQTYAWTDDTDGVPLVWESSYGNGKFVVTNIGMIDKAYRGFYAASLSLIGDVFLYPVINGSVFYLDDFPSQVPEGFNEYIDRDFNTTIRDFYINIWWPDMMNLADKYGMKYTGLAIECYDDAIDGTTEANPDTGTFLNFGNMLLRKGGELGYHGYNHQPLCLGNVDYKGIFNYKTWKDLESMEKAFQHLVDLCDVLFPDVAMSVYVPPSNLLSEEGKQMLLREFPEVRTLSGIYLPDASLDFSLVQEYTVSKTGVVDQPRIISGCALDDFMEMAAMSELNMHYVNNHFTHPDDALDPDRGALLGWRELATRFDGYLNWLYTSAPNIRNLTGTECSAAVQRFAAVVPEKTVYQDRMVLHMENFYDDAQFLVRFNAQEPNSVTGGTLTHLTGNLYLLSADLDTVTVFFK